MPTNKFHMSGLITFKVEINSTEVTVGALTEATITGQEEHDEFYDPENMTFDEVIRREVAFVADFTFREFDEAFGQYWLGGGSDSTSTTLDTTSNQAAQFTVTLEQGMTDYTNSTGDEALKIVLDNCHTDEFPFLELAQGDYNEQSVTMRGNGITYTKVTV